MHMYLTFLCVKMAQMFIIAKFKPQPVAVLARNIWGARPHGECGSANL